MDLWEFKACLVCQTLSQKTKTNKHAPQTNHTHNHNTHIHVCTHTQYKNSTQQQTNRNHFNTHSLAVARLTYDSKVIQCDLLPISLLPNTKTFNKIVNLSRVILNSAKDPDLKQLINGNLLKEPCEAAWYGLSH